MIRETSQPRDGLTLVPSKTAGGAAPGLERQLAHLDRAIEAARGLGIPTDDAERVRDEAGRRLGFPADVYVLALVGGTGVGKSSLLNALAGAPVSTTSARRPTTDEAVAWVPRSARSDVADLLDWLAVERVREHELPEPSSVAILDLPDIDSIEPPHRERVEAVLPKVDAVAWVTDPEKYHDAVLHDEFLRAWLPRLATQVVVLNKRDRLPSEAVEQIRADLQRGVRRLGVSGAGGLRVLATSAVPGEEHLGELRGWLAGAIDAKRVVRQRLSAAIIEAIEGLARAAGVDPRLAARPHLVAARRRDVTIAVTDEVLRAIDLPALERQAIAATRARARGRGAGPVGWLASFAYRLSGREARDASPHTYLVRWRERSPLGPAVEAMRAALIEPVRAASPAVRPVLAASVEPERLRAGLETAVDRAVDRDSRPIPSSWLWTVIGALQTVATAGIALSLAWIAIWILARPPVDSLIVPVLGTVPIPFVALVVSLVASYLLARLLGLHAGWLGRRWAARLRRDVEQAVATQVRDVALVELDRLEVARRALWLAARAATADAGRV